MSESQHSFNIESIVEICTFFNTSSSFNLLNSIIYVDVLICILKRLLNSIIYVDVLICILFILFRFSAKLYYLSKFVIGDVILSENHV